MVNWYKKAQAGNPYYDEVGHGFNQPYNEDATPNYLWTLVNGSIEVEEENTDFDPHSLMFEMSDEEMDRTYRGRWDGMTNNLSIIKPQEGVLAFREEPSWLRKRLHEKFTINKIYTY
jgi:hypothetical protein